MSANDIEAKRDFVMGLYSGPGWKRRVRNMDDAQVVAIFLRKQSEPKKSDPSKESGNDPAPF